VAPPIMDADSQALLADLQFVLARILWAPHCDRDRAVLLAELAARTHPDPDKREAMAEWLKLRATPAIDHFALAYLRRNLATR